MTVATELPSATRIVAVAVPNHAGRLIGKRLPAERWATVVESGMAMPDFHLVSAVDNFPVLGMEVTGLHTGFRNGVLRPDVSTLTALPWEPGTMIILCDTFDSAGDLVGEAPRSVLRHQVTRLAERGFEATVASELEFYLFRTSYEEAHRTAYRRVEPSYHRQPDNDILVAGYDEPFLAVLRNNLAAMGIPVWATQGEGGRGQHELNLRHSDALRAADAHMLYKLAVKATAQQMGCSVTFMAKPSGDVGSGCHIHLSILKDGRNVLGRPDGSLSQPGERFLAGLLAFSGDFMVLHAPYANSYRRLRPGSWSPVNMTWGFDNRTCLVRVVGEGQDLRFEFRLPGADVNPYLASAALLDSALAGLDEGLALPSPVTGDAYESGAPRLPADLTEAVQRFEASERARAALGPSVHGHLLGMARNERDEARVAVTDWDLQRGFENA